MWLSELTGLCVCLGSGARVRCAGSEPVQWEDLVSSSQGPLLGVSALGHHPTGLGLCQSPRSRASATPAVGAEDGLESCDVTQCRSGS